MNEKRITEQELREYECYLRSGEYAEGSIELYVRAVKRLRTWLGERELDKDAVVAWKESLVSSGSAPATINSLLAAVNRFFCFTRREDCRVRQLRIQRRVFCCEERELTREEYLKLVAEAENSGQKRLALLIETLGSTGIRVGETRYVTVEAARRRQTDISLKGKIRTILLPDKLCRKLLKYAKEAKIDRGEIFITRSGRSLSRKQIWAELKVLCKKAGVAERKVFPHNFRHLFARTFYRTSRDVVLLSDVLGHSSVETTRIYLISTGAEHARELERLGLVL